MTRTMAAAEARGKFPSILDDAEKGFTTVILRHSRPSAAVVPASELPAFNMFRRIMREIGETLEVSRNPEIIAAVQRSQDEVNRGQIFWDDEG
jgi:prevent-host-death family protein